MLKNIFSKIKQEQIITGVISSIIASLLIMLLKYIFNINLIKFANAVSYNIFVYLTIFTLVFVVLYFIYNIFHISQNPYNLLFRFSIFLDVQSTHFLPLYRVDLFEVYLYIHLLNILSTRFAKL